MNPLSFNICYLRPCCDFVIDNLYRTGRWVFNQASIFDYPGNWVANKVTTFAVPKLNTVSDVKVVSSIARAARVCVTHVAVWNSKILDILLEISTDTHEHATLKAGIKKFLGNPNKNVNATEALSPLIRATSLCFIMCMLSRLVSTLVPPPFDEVLLAPTQSLLLMGLVYNIASEKLAISPDSSTEIQKENIMGHEAPQEEPADDLLKQRNRRLRSQPEEATPNSDRQIQTTDNTEGTTQPKNSSKSTSFEWKKRRFGSDQTQSTANTSVFKGDGD